MVKKDIFLFYIFFILYSLLYFSPLAYPQIQNYPFLNQGFSYEVISPDNDIMHYHPEGAKVVSIEYNSKDFNFQYTYHVFGKITPQKLQLMEYDLLIRETLKNYIIPLNILNLLSREQLYTIHKRLYLNYHFIKNMKFPEEAKEVHEMYVKFIKSAKSFLDFKASETTDFKNTTIVYRILNSYNSFPNQELFQKANMEWFNILEKNGIQPY